NVLVPAVQTWPVLLTTLPVAALAAPSISASSKMIYGDLPPNSNDTFLKSSAAFFIILAPVGPDPVNDIILTFGCSLSGFPTPWPSPLDRKSTRLNSSHVSISYAVFCLKKKNYNYFHPMLILNEQY